LSDAFREKRQLLALSFGVALLTFLAYLPSITNDFVNWDDNVNIINNVHIRSLNWAFFKWAFTDTYLSYWQPLNWLTHAIDYSLWELNPFGHHLTNTLLHAVNTFIVVSLVFKLVEFSRRIQLRDGLLPLLDRRGVLVTAGVTGLLFGLHPLNVESVAWVTGRPGMLSAFFYLLSIFTYLGSVALRGQNETPDRCTEAQYVLSLVFFALSLASKPMAITLPLVLLLLDWYLTRIELSAPGIRKAILRIIPYCVLAFAVSMVAVFSEKISSSAAAQMIVPLPDRLLVIAKSLLLYLVRIVVPVDLIPYYEYPDRISLLSAEYFVPVLLVICITAVCILLLKKQKIWFVIWGYFIITLLPVIGLIKVRSVYMADRYVYLSIIGPMLILGLGAARLWTNSGVKGISRWIMAVLAAALLLAMTSLTVRQEGVWKSSLIMWNYIIARKPLRYPVAYHNRSILFVDAGEYERAIEDANQALTLAPEYPDAYHNRGNAFAGKGNFARAIADYSRAISLKPADAVIYNSLGLAFAARGEFDSAIEAYGKAISLRPDYGDAFNNRGLAFDGKGAAAQAFADFDRAGQLKPGDASVHVNRGLAFAGQGRAELAEKEYTAALELKPAPTLAASAHSNRGILRFSEKKYDGALADFNAAAALNPASVAAFNNRGLIFMALGEYARAAEDFSRVLVLAPGLERAYLDRGEAYLQGRKPEAAKEDFLTACRLGNTVGCSRARSLE